MFRPFMTRPGMTRLAMIRPMLSGPAAPAILGQLPARAILLVLTTAMVMSFPDPSRAERPAPSLILIACAQGSPAPLCQALIQALAEAGAGRILRRLPPGAPERPMREGDIAVTLQVSGSPGALSGRLDWQTPDGARHSGPRIPVPSPVPASAGLA